METNLLCVSADVSLYERCQTCNDFPPTYVPPYNTACFGPLDRAANQPPCHRFPKLPTNKLIVSRRTPPHLHQAEVLTSEGLLVPASDANKEMLLELLAGVEPSGSTNFEEVSSTLQPCTVYLACERERSGTT